MPPRSRRPRAAIASASAVLVTTLAVAMGLAGCGTARTVDTIGEIDFSRALPIPPLAESTLDDEGVRHFALDAQAGTTEFVDGVSTTTWGYSQPYLGPTLVAERGESVEVDVTNSLEVPTSVHWHGMHLPAAMDGGPHQLVAAGDDWHPSWTIDQPAATLWYHPHPHGQTEAQVLKGLAGLFLVRDPLEAALPLPRDYGVDDVPVVVQDVTFTGDGQISLAHNEFAGALGDTLLVNGAIGPYLDVTTDLIRLRLVNGSSARPYDFAFADDREFTMIGSDGGLLETPLALDSIALSPGERAEILVALEPGETIELQSREPDLGRLFVGAGGSHDRFDVLQLRAADVLEHRGEVPLALVPMTRYQEGEATAERAFTLDGTQINGRNMDPERIDFAVTLGTTEIWNVRNGMAAPHSFHVHDVQFQVLSIGGAPPPPELAGWKDTVYLRPDMDYRLIMRFEEYADPNIPYLFHCHLLQHEDAGMMGQFVIVRPGEAAGTIEGARHDH